MLQTNLLVVLVVSVAISMTLIPIAWRFAPQLGLVDEPNPRKVHRTAIPTIGGFGIAVGAVLPVLLVLELDPLVRSYVLGALVLVAFGVWDDAREINHYLKFTGQVFAVGLAIFYGDLWIERLPFVNAYELSAWFGKAFTLFAMIGMINAINHSDGLDGLAGGESLLSLIVIVFLASIFQDTRVVVIATAAIGSILGFLRYNVHPARVFMGDTGSQFLGYTLGFLAVLVTQAEYSALSPAVVLLVLGLPVIDILAVLFLRIKKSMHWFRATRNHIHHRLIDVGFDHHEVVIVIYSLHAVFVTSAVFLRYQNDYFIITLYLLYATSIFALLTYAEGRGRRAQEQVPLISVLTRSMKGARRLWPTFYLIVAICVPLFLLSGSVWIESVSWDFGLICSALLLIILLGLGFWERIGSVTTRSAIYVTAIFIAYLTVFEPGVGSAYMDQLNIAFFSVLAASIGLTVRLHRSLDLKLSTMDYLNFLGTLTILLFGGYYLRSEQAWLVVVEAIILIYGCELLIYQSKGRWSVLNVSSVATLGVLTLRGLVF